MTNAEIKSAHFLQIRRNAAALGTFIAGNKRLVMSADCAFQDRVDTAEESHRLRIVLARVRLTAEETRARAEYYCTFENAGWDRTAFRVYRAVMVFADGSLRANSSGKHKNEVRRDRYGVG